jgi:hypothetical protein
MKTKLITLIIASIFLISLVSALSIDSIDTPNQIKPGETTEISITLETGENESVTNVVVALDLMDVPFAPHDSSNEITIEEIEEDEKETADFDILALPNAESGIYKIPFSIEYTLEGENETLTKQGLVTLTVNSEPQISVERNDGLILKGRKNEIQLSIINKGLSDVKFLDIEISEMSGITILSQKSIYIGDLDSDDFDSANFEVFIKGSTQKNINLPVKIIYRDITNKEYTENILVNLRVYSKEEAIDLGLLKKSNTTNIIIGVVVLIVGYIAYKKIKKFRRARKG